MFVSSIYFGLRRTSTEWVYDYTGGGLGSDSIYHLTSISPPSHYFSRNSSKPGNNNPCKIYYLFSFWESLKKDSGILMGEEHESAIYNSDKFSPNQL